jgi:hypothetical protein
MPSYGQTVTLQYVAWDVSANAPKTGDVSNHTLRWVKDGVSSAPTNTPTEVDATNAKGVYKLVLTGTEASCQVGTLCGVSATSNIVILPITMAFENLPLPAPTQSGGLPTVGTGSGQIGLASGAVTVGTNNDKTGYSVTQAFPPNFPSMKISSAGYVGLDFAVVNTPGSATILTNVLTQQDFTQAVPLTNTRQSHGDALSSALGLAAGKMTQVGTTLTLYASDNLTIVRAFALDSATNPSQRI